MFIPLGTDRPLRHRPYVTVLLICANVVAHVVMGTIDTRDHAAYLDALHRFWSDPRNGPWWGLLTGAFLHGGWMHLAGNMLTLWVFGPNVEDRFGRVGFAAFYFAAAVVSGIVHGVASVHPAIGASGAVAAITGAYIVLFPRTRVLLLMGMVLPAWIVIGLAIAYNVWLTGSGTANRIATWAHLGGYAMGFSVALMLLATRLLAREPSYDLFSIARHANRRRQFRVAAAEAETLRKQRVEKTEDDEKLVGFATARAAIAANLDRGETHAAADRYDRLIADTAQRPAEGTLTRRHQLDLANHLYALGRHAAAATAYERFAMVYRDDPEAPGVKVMLALVAARNLRDHPRARAALDGVMGRLRQQDHIDLAKRLLEEIGEPAAAVEATSDSQPRSGARQ